MFFDFEDSINWSNVGLGLVSGWDSFRHIEFILELENKYSVKFSSEEIDQTISFQSLSRLLNSKKTSNA